MIAFLQHFAEVTWALRWPLLVAYAMGRLATWYETQRADRLDRERAAIASVTTLVPEQRRAGDAS